MVECSRRQPWSSEWPSQQRSTSQMVSEPSPSSFRLGLETDSMDSLKALLEEFRSDLQKQVSSIHNRLSGMLDRVDRVQHLRSSVRSPDSRIQFQDSITSHFDFPIYDGFDDPSIWMTRANEYFSFHHTPVGHKVDIASCHLQGKALDWFWSLLASRPSVSWLDLVEEFNFQFSSAATNCCQVSSSHSLVSSTLTSDLNFSKSISKIQNEPSTISCSSVLGVVNSKSPQYLVSIQNAPDNAISSASQHLNAKGSEDFQPPVCRSIGCSIGQKDASFVGQNDQISRYLFEGHLTDRHKALITFATPHNWNAVAESSQGQGDNLNSTVEVPRVPEMVAVHKEEEVEPQVHQQTILTDFSEETQHPEVTEDVGGSAKTLRFDDTAALNISVLRLDPTLEVFSLLADPTMYAPITIDLSDRGELGYRFTVLTEHLSDFVVKAMTIEGGTEDAKGSGVDFVHVFSARSARLMEEPAAYEKLGLANLLNMRPWAFFLCLCHPPPEPPPNLFTGPQPTLEMHLCFVEKFLCDILIGCQMVPRKHMNFSCYSKDTFSFIYGDFVVHMTCSIDCLPILDFGRSLAPSITSVGKVMLCCRSKVANIGWYLQVLLRPPPKPPPTAARLTQFLLSLGFLHLLEEMPRVNVFLLYKW